MNCRVRLFRGLPQVSGTKLASGLERQTWADIRDQVIAILALLQSSEGHLCPWNVFLRIFKIFEL